MLTLSRTGRPTTQMECVGGSAWLDRYRVRSAVCSRIEGDWVCDMEPAVDYEISNVKVVCEGDDHPNDEYIVDGSCSVRYELNHKSVSPTKGLLAYLALSLGVFVCAMSTIAVASVSILVVMFLMNRRKPYKPDLTKLVIPR